MNELFHALADPGSAAARRAASAPGVREKVSFRNVVYPEVLADLVARGGSESELPALWDGERLHRGLPAVLAALDRLRGA